MLAGLLFALNALLNFALTLVLARVLPPDAFGALSLLLASTLLASMSCLDWARFAALRFHTADAVAGNARLRPSLDAAFLASVAPAMLVALAFGIGLSGLEATPAAIAALCALPLAFGAFEYLATLLRSRFDDRTFLAMSLLRHGLSFLLVVPVAWRIGDASVTATLLAAAFLPVLAVGLFGLRGASAKYATADLAQMRLFAAFGLPIVAASLLDQGIGLINRAWLAREVGLVAAGTYALIFDTAFKLLGVTAAAAEAALAPRLMALHGADPDASRERLGRNLAITLLLVAPLGLALVVAAEPLAALMFAPEFRGPFVAFAPIAVAAALCQTVQISMLRPAFQVAQRTGLLLAASSVTFVVDVALLILAPRADLGWAALTHLAALAAGALVLTVAAARARSLVLPMADLLKIALTTLLATLACLLVISRTPGLMAPLAGLAAGGLVYGGLIAMLDVLGLRTLVTRLLRARRGGPATPAKQGASALTPSTEGAP